MYQNIFYRKEAARPWAAFFCLHEKFSCDIITAWTMDLRCSTFSFFNSKPAACRFDSGMSLCYSTSHIIVFFRVNSFGMLESIFAGSDSGRKRCIEKMHRFCLRDWIQCVIIFRYSEHFIRTKKRISCLEQRRRSYLRIRPFLFIFIKRWCWMIHTLWIKLELTNFY